ncbi:acyl-CoA dehydrogenase family protein [Pseudonocardia sp. RS010]|uniref:acyl-CoA dehydrogenase family protein n=1 Tax=Pseudonocardia sp. RS010 TaxID=3385979 RepID=UPI0039A06BC3
MSDLDVLLDQLLGRDTGNAGTGVDGAAWGRLDDAGLTRVNIASELGGSDGDLRDAATIVTRAAEAGVSGPLPEAVVTVARLAALSGLPVGPGLVTTGRAADAVATTGSGAARLTTTVRDVPWAEAARSLWLTAPTTSGATLLAVLDRGEWTAKAGHNLAGESRDEVLVDVELRRDRTAELDPGIGQEIALLEAFSRSGQLLGAARGCLALAVEHTGVRNQFGRPLSSRQAVRHQLALMAGEVAAAETAVAEATEVLVGGDPAATILAVAAAKIQGNRVAGVVARGAHQLHGAVGTTAEHPLHHLTTRLWSWCTEGGTTRRWAAAVAELLAATRGADLWAFLTDSANPDQRRCSGAFAPIYSRSRPAQSPDMRL